MILLQLGDVISLTSLPACCPYSLHGWAVHERSLYFSGSWCIGALLSLCSKLVARLLDFSTSFAATVSDYRVSNTTHTHTHTHTENGIVYLLNQFLKWSVRGVFVSLPSGGGVRGGRHIMRRSDTKWDTVTLHTFQWAARWDFNSFQLTAWDDGTELWCEGLKVNNKQSPVNTSSYNNGRLIWICKRSEDV